MIKRTLLLLTASLAAASVMAKDITGVVKDAKTGDVIIGSVVRIKELPEKTTTTGLDGTFSLKALPDKGKYTLIVEYISYKTREVAFDASTATTVDVALDQDTKELGEVVVTGYAPRNNDRSAIDIEKNSRNVINVLSQQSIQLSPDVNVAGVLTRVSGVVMEQDATGQASYAVLRGMDKRYNYTLVNGVKIPSPDDKNRYIPLNIFPSDLMDRLEVTKSLTADMEGDAAGGVVNMAMKDAPGRFKVQTNAAVGYSDYFFRDGRDYLTTDRGNYTHKAPYEALGPDYKASATDFRNGPTSITRHSAPAPNFIGGLSVGNRFWGNRLGVMLAASIQNTFRGTERTYNSTKMASGQQAMYIYEMQKRHYSIHDLNGGLHAKIDLNLGNHKIEWYNMLISSKSTSVRYSNSINTEYISSDSYTQDDEVRSMQQTQTIFATHLKGTHRLTNDFTVDWSGLFSTATEKDPDRVYTTLTSSVTADDNAAQGLFAENANITRTLPKNMERRFQHNSDKDLAGYVNLSYDSHFSDNTDAVWKAGAQYRRKTRENRYYSYQFNPTDISQRLDGNGFDQYDDIDWTCTTPYSQASQLNYNSKEFIGAVYAMATLRTPLGELYAGLRAEHTNQRYTMLQRFRNMGQMGEQSYWDWMPSASLKWQPRKNMNVRLSYYRSINRPGFYEIVPYRIMGEEYMEQGNPSLKRARIDNVDLRWEWFPSPTEQVMAGVFYKFLRDPIEQVFTPASGLLGSGADAYYMPANLGNAKNMGVEVDVVKYIRHFGVKANYTYTHSAITTTKRQYKPGSAEYETRVTQKRPLVNQAPHTANVSLLYKDTEHGWNAQLASSYTGKKLALVSPFKDADQWDRAMFSLDFSAEKKFRCGLGIFFKTTNLTDAKRERYLRTVNESNMQYPGQRGDRTVIGTYRYGRTFLLGVRYTL